MRCANKYWCNRCWINLFLGENVPVLLVGGGVMAPGLRSALEACELEVLHWERSDYATALGAAEYHLAVGADGGRRRLDSSQLQRLAARGDAAARFELACRKLQFKTEHLLAQPGVNPQQSKEAMVDLLYAAEGDHADAMALLAWLHLTVGDATGGDPQRAVHWAEKGVAADSDMARLVLARALANESTAADRRYELLQQASMNCAPALLARQSLLAEYYSERPWAGELEYRRARDEATNLDSIIAAEIDDDAVVFGSASGDSEPALERIISRYECKLGSQRARQLATFYQQRHSESGVDSDSEASLRYFQSAALQGDFNAAVTLFELPQSSGAGILHANQWLKNVRAIKAQQWTVGQDKWLQDKCDEYAAQRGYWIGRHGKAALWAFLFPGPFLLLFHFVFIYLFWFSILNIFFTIFTANSIAGFVVLVSYFVVYTARLNGKTTGQLLKFDWTD